MPFTAGFFGLLDFTGLPVGAGQRLIAMLNELLVNGVTDVQGLGLKLNGNGIAVVRRKGVKRHPIVDNNPQITLCKSPNLPISIERTGFGKTSVIYPIEIAIVSPNPRDWLTNLDTYSDWLDKLITLFIPPLLTDTNLWKTVTTGVGGANHVYDVSMSVGEFLEPDAMVSEYDVIAIDLEVKTVITA